MDEETHTPRRREPTETALDEDFLYHLSRGSDFLIENRVVQAKEELERALSFRPEDAKSQDLLAGVYFRLGVYPRAIEIWSRLVRSHTDDATLRVNLGLALLKTGQPEDAKLHLDRAIELEPEHARAWGYLGLVHWRMGKLDEARDAFSRGGQASMARRMEELVAESTEELGGAAPASVPDVHASEIAAVRTSAGAAIDRLERSEAPLVVEPSGASAQRKPSGTWKVTEAGTDPIPRTSRPPTPMSADAPMALGGLLDWWAPSIPADQPLVVTPNGSLVMSSRTAVHARGTQVRALRGAPSRATILRRFRRASEEILGDEEPILRWEGEVLAVLGPRSGERFQALRIEEDLLYVVERFVEAFDDRVSFESGRLPQHAGEARLMQFRGSGTIVLRLPRAPTALPIATGIDARVAPEALVGWTGRLFPVEAPGDGASAESSQLVERGLVLRGEGTLLLV